MVEDNPGDAQLLKEMVHQTCGEDVEVTHARTLSAALTEVKIHHFSAVLLDLGLPDSHGLDTLDSMLSSAPEVPVVVVTGYDDVEFGVKAQRMGAEGYLFKSSLEERGFGRVIERAVLEPRAQRPSGPGETVESELPKIFGEIYRAERVVGGGSTGTVYYGVDTELEREVAIKVLAEHLVEGTSSKERFEREAKTLAQLDHPAIVPIYASGRRGQEIYFVMPYIRGASLASLLRGKPLSLDWFMPCLRSICEGLDYAHSVGVVHRDLKPDNIILSPGGDSAKILDFGIAMNTSLSRMTQYGASVGTPSYMAPEQAFNTKSIGPATDQYALGVVLYHVLTGNLPFEADKASTMVLMHMSEDPEPICVLNPELGEEMSEVVARAMAKSQDDRYRTCKAFYQALRRAAVRRAEEGPTSVVPNLAETLADGMMDETDPRARQLEEVELNSYVPEGLFGDIQSGAPDEPSRGRLISASHQLLYSSHPSAWAGRRVLDLFLGDEGRIDDVMAAVKAIGAIEDRQVASKVKALLSQHLGRYLTSAQELPSQSSFEALAWVSGPNDLPLWQQLFFDPDAERRTRALRASPILCSALVEPGATAAQRRFTQLLFWASEDEDERSSVAALAALARLGVSESAELLLQRYRTASGSEIQNQVLDALDRLFVDDALPAEVKASLRDEMQQLSSRPSGIEMTVRAKLAKLASMNERELKEKLRRKKASHEE